MNSVTEKSTPRARTSLDNSADDYITVATALIMRQLLCNNESPCPVKSLFDHDDIVPLIINVKGHHAFDNQESKVNFCFRLFVFVFNVRFVLMYVLFVCTFSPNWFSRNKICFQ